MIVIRPQASDRTAVGSLVKAGHNSLGRSAQEKDNSSEGLPRSSLSSQLGDGSVVQGVPGDTKSCSKFCRVRKARSSGGSPRKRASSSQMAPRFPG